MPLQQHASTPDPLPDPEGGPGWDWWEVDLGRDWHVRAVDVYGPLQARPVLQYPQVVRVGQVGPFEMDLVGEGGGVSATLQFEGASDYYGKTGQLGVARYVRIRRQRLDGEGLRLLEVEVWAEDTWHCQSHCQHGTCTRYSNTDARNGDGNQCAADWEECVCDADWVGRDCSTHAMMAWKMLPVGGFDSEGKEGASRGERGGAEGKQEGGREGGGDRFWEGVLFEEALQELQRTQYPAECSGKTAIRMRFENRGAAATFNFIGGMLGYAYMQGKALVLSNTDPWVYAHNEGCTDFECYFLPWSSCPAASLNASGTFDMARSTQEAVFSMVPRRFARKGVFWWHLVLTSFLFRLRPDIAGPGMDLDVDAAIASMRWEEPVLGVHVRVGDSCNKWAVHFNGACLPLSEHLAAIRSILLRYAPRTLFVASDDASVPGQLARALEGEVRVVWLEEGAMQDKSQTSSGFQEAGVPAATWIEHRLQSGELPKKQMAYQALMDVLVLARCSLLVLHLASNFSRLALNLAIIHHKRLLPYISVDGPMCYHWQICCQLQPDGTSTMC